MPEEHNQYYFIGRFARTEKQSARFGWPGSSIIASFWGTSLRVDLAEESNHHRYYVLVDGQLQREKLRTVRGRSIYTLCAGLSPGAHRVILYRLTEALFGETHFFGFLQEHGRPFMESTHPRRYIELIGDSISTGYGNEGTNHDSPCSSDTQNHYLTYGAIAARHLDAHLTCIAAAGRGLFSNRGSTNDNLTMPTLWTRTLPAHAQPWDHSHNIPHAVVINLGTNDLTSENPDWSPFPDAYLSFVRQVRARYQSAAIFCTLGPLLQDSWPKERLALSTARQAIAHTVTTLHQENDPQIYFLEFPGQDGSLGYGGDWHPSLTTHQQMAQQVETALRATLAW
jgi:lysophospholipase L1-like esterase